MSQMVVITYCIELVLKKKVQIEDSEDQQFWLSKTKARSSKSLKKTENLRATCSTFTQAQMKNAVF